MEVYAHLRTLGLPAVAQPAWKNNKITRRASAGSLLWLCHFETGLPAVALFRHEKKQSQSIRE